MRNNLRKLLHVKKGISIETIELCIKAYEEKYNLTRKVSEKELLKEEKYSGLKKKNIRTHNSYVADHIETHFGKFLSVVTDIAGIRFKAKRKKALVEHEQDFSDFAYSGVTDDL
jgi:hypothetical protein